MHEPRHVVIGAIDPRTPPIAAMIRELDRYMIELYPAESNHLVDIDALTRPNVRFFAAAADQEYLGCGAIMIHGADYAEIKRVFVSPAARGLGLGKRILETLEGAARKEGLSLLRLETGISQPEALHLFAAFGFSRCGAFGDYPHGDPYSVFMEKRL
ncbi:MAG TPA: GNAT family N-acetyltransferase [Steroidobacteraceae bacterium]|nr:GNAT family N-acetyltransferase [Steroidobacteraceae bacterium]